MQVTEYMPGRAVWYVWLGRSNQAALLGEATSLEAGQVAAVEEAVALLTLVLTHLPGQTPATEASIAP